MTGGYSVLLGLGYVLALLELVDPSRGCRGDVHVEEPGVEQVFLHVQIAVLVLAGSDDARHHLDGAERRSAHAQNIRRPGRNVLDATAVFLPIKAYTEPNLSDGPFLLSTVLP